MLAAATGRFLTHRECVSKRNLIEVSFPKIQGAGAGSDGRELRLVDWFEEMFDAGKFVDTQGKGEGKRRAKRWLSGVISASGPQSPLCVGPMHAGELKKNIFLRAINSAFASDSFLIFIFLAVSQTAFSEPHSHRYVCSSKPVNPATSARLSVMMIKNFLRTAN